MTDKTLLKPVLMMFAAMTFIVFGDAAGKVMTSSGISPFFVAWSRFALAALCMAPFVGVTRDELPKLLDWRVLLRALTIVCAISSILTALKTEPIANVFGGFFIGPVIAYFLAVVVLKERITFQRTVLLLISFIGVLLVVKPGIGMSVGMGFAVLAGALHGAFLVMTRLVAADYRPRFLLFSHLMIGSVVLMPLGILGFPTVTPNIALLVVISAFGSSAGNYLLILVNRTTPANVVAPLVYTQLLSATVVGVLVFLDWPDYLSLIGLVVIMVSGLSSFWLAGRGK